MAVSGGLMFVIYILLAAVCFFAAHYLMEKTSGMFVPIIGFGVVGMISLIIAVLKIPTLLGAAKQYLKPKKDSPIAAKQS